MKLPSRTQLAISMLPFVALACSSTDSTIVGDTDGSSSSSPSPSEPTPITSPSEDSGSSDSGDRSDDGAVSSSETGDEPGAPNSDTVSTSSESGESEESGSTGELQELPSDWCGTESAGRRTLEPIGMPARTVTFDSAQSGPFAHTAWLPSDGVLRAVTYDVDAATWGSTVKLSDEMDETTHVLGATDAHGNALVAHVTGGEPRRAALHHYDAASATWNTTFMSDEFQEAIVTGVHLTDDGHSVATFVRVDPGNEVAHFVYVREGTTTATIKIDTPNGPTEWLFDSAIDPVTGALAFASDAGETGLSLHHRDPVTAELITTPIGSAGIDQHAIGVEALGDGSFIAISARDGEGIFAHHFDGETWLPEVQIVDGAAPHMRVVAEPDGRALVGWFGGQSELAVRSFDVGIGWSAAELVNAPEQQQIVGSDNDLELALGQDGFVVGWHQTTPMVGTDVFARRYHHVEGWDDIQDLDVDHPYPPERIRLVDELDLGRARAVWRRLGGGPYLPMSAYACRETGGGWSAARMVHGVVETYEPRGNDVLIVTRGHEDVRIAEYFVEAE
jgi:hypothetical protein